MLDAETEAVGRFGIDQSLAERIAFGRRREAGTLLKEVESVRMWDITHSRHWTGVIRDRFGGIDQRAIGREGHAWLPKVKACGAVLRDPWRERNLNTGHESGLIQLSFRDGEVDKQEVVSLVGAGRNVRECRDGGGLYVRN